MNCPSCNKTLQSNGDYLFCAEGHGSLITSKILADIDSFDHKDEREKLARENQHLAINCPKCGSLMHVVNYNNTRIIIDSCLKCHSRWLDAGEFKKIKNFEPKFKPEDLLFLNALGKDYKRIIEERPTDHNPRVGSKSSRSDSRIIFPHHSGGSSFGAIRGAGIIGIYRMATHSNFTRFMLLLIIIIFGAMAYLVYKTVG